MLSPLNVVLSLVLAIDVVISRDDQRTAQVISTLLTDSKCPATIVVSDDSPGHYTEGLLNTFVNMHIGQHPLILPEVSDWSSKRRYREPTCQNAVIFGRQITTLSSLYLAIKSQFHVNNAMVVARFTPEDAIRLLFDIQDEKMFVLLEKNGRDLELYSWKANNKTSFVIIRSPSNVTLAKARDRSVNLSGRHLMIGTLTYPPSIIIDSGRGIQGIEPSIIETLSHNLKFTYEFIETSPNEMWGEIFGTADNRTFTGLLGMLVRKEVDIAAGELYISSLRFPYIDYTDIYNFGYESFLVPAPRPYGKWTALFYSFTWPTWLATIVSAFVVIVMLRFVAACSSRYSESPNNDVFADFQYCCLYVIGNLSNVQVQPQNITSGSNRTFLIGWLFATLILSTGYRSGLISYMTFPFTPPTIDTLQQLVDSPLQKVVFGFFFKSILMNSSNQLEKKIGEQLIPHYNLTGMFVSLETDSSAIQSSLNNLLYMAATMYPTTSAGPRVHLIKENLVPAWVAFGLQKNSQLKPYFDKEIQRLIESGLVEHHRTTFAKRLVKWNPKKASDRISFTLDSLQGAFYLLGVGIVASIVVFTIEIGSAWSVFKVRPK
ncbi:probable glutamate receptor [Daphnia magna]|uniref:probable glutamate receptor n=1 Tax=Daphnia magna TaxID=35525 RepID=UPI001E1BA738|nr:probable glutamate receptor [Daphnia magna]